MQHLDLHTLGYSIFANFSERDIIERDTYNYEREFCLAANASERSKNACELMQQQKFAYNDNR